MSISMLTQKGQTTIPRDVREFLGLRPNERIVYIRDGENVYLRAIKGNISDVAGAFKNSMRGKIDFKKLRQKAQAAVAKKAGKG